MSSCLKDYIGFKWCGEVTPESGLYINILPGISLKSIDNLANEEQRTFLQVWNDVQERAIVRLNTFVQNHFAKRYHLTTINESLTLGNKFDTENNQTAAAGQYRGISIDTGFNPSALQMIYVQQLSLYVKADIPAAQVKFFDVRDKNSAVEIYSLEKDLTSGWNNFTVSRLFNCKELFIGYDATNIESVSLSINENFPWSYGEACYERKGSNCFYLHGASVDMPFGNLELGDNSYGLTGTFSLQCSFEPLLCANKNIFKAALWYLEGAEAMFERIYSDRLNRYTTADRKSAEELYSKYSEAAENELMNAIEGIELRCDDCIAADAPLTLVNSLP